VRERAEWAVAQARYVSRAKDATTCIAHDSRVNPQQAVPSLAFGLRLDSQEYGRLLAFFPALLVIAIAYPLRYHLTLAEPDLVRMMAGLVYGAATGEGLQAGMHYGQAFSFGYYELFYALAPRHLLSSPDSVATLMNALGLLSGLACALTGTAYLMKVFGVPTGLAAALLFFLSPMMLPVALSAHPIVPATACLFAAGWLLCGEPGKGRARWLVAVALLVLGLSLRAEIVLAFPFLWLARQREPAHRWSARQLVIRGVMLTSAFVAFLLLQQRYLEPTSAGAASKLISFVQTFLSVSHIARGAAVLVLAAGLATTVVVVLAIWKHGRNASFYLAGLLALPALVLWLPNPTPARHFYFVVLAACVMAAVFLCRGLKESVNRALLTALMLVAMNQALAEAINPFIQRHYAWSYQAIAARRATQQSPLGFFPLDQRANQKLAAMEREEAMGITAHAPARLVVLGHSQHQMIARLIARYSDLKWQEYTWRGIIIEELKSPSREIVLVDNLSGWPADVTRLVLSDSPWRDWPVYVQPTTVSQYDKTPVPAAQRFVAR